MKTIILSLFIALFAGTALIMSAPTVQAVSLAPACSGSAAGTDVCAEINSGQASASNPVIGLLKTVIGILSIIIGVASVIILIISGIRLMTASGDAQGIAGARSAIIYAVIGLAIVALSQFLVAFVLNKVG